MPDTDHNSRSGIVAKSSGFSLHAGVACSANERDKLERICRYIARPAIAEERLSLNSNGNVIYRLKKPWDDGTTAISLTPHQLLERLVALVPRPRVHLTRFHGVFAPHYKYRKQIVPKKKTVLEVVSEKPPGPRRMNWARLLKKVFNIDVTMCPKCSGTMKVIAAIEDPPVIKKILNHLGLPSAAPVLAPARGPPESNQLEFQQDSQA